MENGCHDNPMLDVTNDNQPEMQEKKPSTNGLTGGGERGKDDSSRWQVMGRLIKWMYEEDRWMNRWMSE